MIYKVDGTNVNDRTDWRQVTRPARSRSSEFTFPGLARRFRVDGPAMPPDISVAGFLEATGGSATIAANTLIAAARTWAAYIGDGTYHTLRIYNTIYAEAVLAGFRMIGELNRADDPDGTLKVRQACVFDWRLLVDDWTAA